VPSSLDSCTVFRQVTGDSIAIEPDWSANAGGHHLPPVINGEPTKAAAMRLHFLIGSSTAAAVALTIACGGYRVSARNVGRRGAFSAVNSLLNIDDIRAR
jgi:hypothetical protein